MGAWKLEVRLGLEVRPVRVSSKVWELECDNERTWNLPAHIDGAHFLPDITARLAAFFQFPDFLAVR